MVFDQTTRIGPCPPMTVYPIPLVPPYKGFNPRETTPAGLTVFEVIRQNDESGVSGTGKVLEGVVWADGSCSVRWVAVGADSSWVNYGNENESTGFHKFMAIHVSSHPTNDVIMKFTRGPDHWEWKQKSSKADVQRAYLERLVEQLSKFNDVMGGKWLPGTVEKAIAFINDMAEEWFEEK